MTRLHGSSSFAWAMWASLVVASGGVACDRALKPDPGASAGTPVRSGTAPAAGVQAKELGGGGSATNPSLPGVSGDPELDAKLARALASKGGDYAPRTRHLHPDGRPKFTNRLIEQTSPYLLQHAHNPVNWRPWSDEAFQAALAQDKPVLLSIGYSTCHWCHVMERESFEDEEIAAFINANYIAIKVDREERPDVDEVYMDAVRSLNGGRGGWPMTLLLTAERQPFFGGTYLPPRDNARGRRPGFLTVLQEHAEQYKHSQGDMVERARKVSERIAAQSTPRPGARAPGPAVIRRTVQQLLARHDAEWGGFGGAPKFPRPANLELLTRWIHRTGDPEALAALTKTLDKMIDGGMHDHVGGGFHRYATDARWLVPHFEKMLYDNAQLTVALLEAHAITGNARYSKVARETLDYLKAEMRSPQGAFYSATDADSPVPGKQEHEEGWFFTWTPAELETVLGAELAKTVSAYYGVRPRGNFEGRTILHTWREDQVVATELGLELVELNAQLKRARGLLYDARLKRPPPLRDDKILAAWNGLALSAYSHAARTLDDEAYLDDARRLGMFLVTNMVKDQRLHRSYKAGTLGGRGFLDDYAFVIQGLLDLHEASSEPRWLDAAINLQAQLDAHFADPKGGYFTTADDGEVLLSRQKPGYDGAEPSGNSVAALNLLRLHALTLDEAYLETGRRVFLAFAQALARGGQGLPRMLVALDFFHDRPLQVFVVDASEDAQGSARLERAWRQTFSPNKVSAFVPVAEVALRAKQLPGVAEKLALKGLSTAYVCEGMVCQKPTADPVLFAEQLSRVIPYDKSARE